MSEQNDVAELRHDYTPENHDALVSFFGTHMHGGSGAGGRLGVEVEHFIVFDDGVPMAYYPSNGRIGVRDVLEELSHEYPERQYTTEGELIGLNGPGGSVTLEPAAQLEVSLPPFRTIAEVEQNYRDFRELVDTYLADHAAHIVSRGYHPTHKAFDLELIPKRRYDYMNDYFTRVIHTHGERMMRASASTQVSIDFADEADGIRKLRVASAIAPVLGAISDNAPVFEGEPNQLPLCRLRLWRNVDNDRCGVVPGVFDEGFSFSAYADWLLATCPIFVTRPAADDPNGPSTRAVYGLTAAEAYGDAPMSAQDLAQLGSMFWPDARLKQFVEIRPADCMPPEQVLGYAALIKGVFYSESALETIESMLGVQGTLWPLTASDVEDAIANITAHGMDGLVYGTPLAEWEQTLFTLARESLPASELAYLDPLEEFAGTKPWWRVTTA